MRESRGGRERDTCLRYVRLGLHEVHILTPIPWAQGNRILGCGALGQGMKYLSKKKGDRRALWVDNHTIITIGNKSFI